MKRIQLRFETLQQVVGTDDLAVIILTDMPRRRCLSMVCDADMSRQLIIRLQGKKEVTRTMLPEVLLQMAHPTYELMIVGIYDGQYQVLLMDVDHGETTRIRLSDAVLLTLISEIPLFIEEGLLKRQSIPFDEHAKGVAIPINTMDTQRLRAALDHAVDEENYELASQLRDEINRRTDHQP